ncbi:hypothetical protein F4781DRAFT_424364 [Annulohypoxylon bovei var. microspora]|nr:hypothetical protein F4781DRAFT_424364 [Annulohypoxylon bovei var. microspora]
MTHKSCDGGSLTASSSRLSSPDFCSVPTKFELHLSPSPASEIRQRSIRSNTFKSIQNFKDFEGHPGWRPGAEPGIDPSKPDGGQGTVPNLQAECHITVIDFSQETLEVHRLNNQQLVNFIKIPQPSWVECRWININGLSWDVIQTLGSYKNLDPLNIEDAMTTSNPPKKLVRVVEDDSDDEGSNDSWSVRSFDSVKKTARKIQGWFASENIGHTTTPSTLEKGMGLSTHSHGPAHMPTGPLDTFDPNRLRTLQEYRASRNSTRTAYMEEHSALAPRGLAVMVEQVSVFMTTDNTIISFFEQSANDVEKPILARLASSSTILRRSCATSMVMQAIIDAIIDMAIPVAACYADVLGDLELDVLKRPNVKDTQKLYIIISEINKMFGLVNPIQTLVKTLRDRAKLTQKAVATKELRDSLGGVTISSTSYPYLGDVYDHCVLVTGDLASLKQSAENMVQLIFNTVLTNQSSIMTSLSVIGAIVLPLMLMTSYFGQNFDHFPAVKEHGVDYFWHIAIPVVVGTIMIVKYGTMYDLLKQFLHRGRKRRVKKVLWAKINKMA